MPGLSLLDIDARLSNPRQGPDEALAGNGIIACDILRVPNGAPGIRFYPDAPMTALTSFSLAAALLTLSACTLLDNPKPTDQTAMVKDGRWGKVYRGGYVEIVSVSGVEPVWRLHSALSIPAGDRSAWFYVYLCNEGAMVCTSGVPVAQAQVSFNVQGGHTYRPRAQEQVNGSNRFWVWVEDEATGEAVGGTVPGAPES
jgi:hypothetical protein